MRLAVSFLLLSYCASAAYGQEFTFGTDLIAGVESGRAGGGFATGLMHFAIDGNRLTAVLRNTSPDSENNGDNSGLNSPAARRFDFAVGDTGGGSLELLSWELTALGEAGSAVVLGNDQGGGLDKWRMTQQNDHTFRVKSRGGRDPKAPLFNREATAGFPAGDQYFTEAVLVATFNANIGSSDLNPELRFVYLGNDNKGKTLHGVPSSSVNPEPTSLAVWAGLLTVMAIPCRRRRRSRG